MTTGMMRSPWFAVFALNSLQKPMMLTPCWPSAGPTGGEGFAFPAGICSFTIACTFFAMSEPFDLVVLEFHGGQSSEDGHHDLQLAALGIEVVDGPLEVHEGSLDHPHLVTLLEGRLQLGLLRALPIWRRMLSTSESGRWTGLAPEPTKPVTLGVER